MTVDDVETRLRSTYRRVLAQVPDAPPPLGSLPHRRARLRRPAVALALAAAVLAGIVVAAGLVAGRERGSSTVNVAGTGGGAITARSVQAGPIGLAGTAQAVSCVSASWCVAVGSTPLNDPTPGVNGPRYYRGVHDLFTGHGWRSMPAGDTGGLAAGLSGVSCVSTNWCVAVGETTGGGPQRTVIETWNGKRWNRTPSPNASGSNTLLAVACANHDFCVAVGYLLHFGTASRNLAEVFNGQRWTLRPPPSPEAGNDNLSSVSCPTAGWCMAVGDFYSSTPSPPTVDRYANGRWSQLKIPYLTHSGPALAGIACPAKEDCTAVGTVDPAHGLTEHYDHGTWTGQQASDRAGANLEAVACHPHRCVAVGTTPYGTRGQRPLLQVLPASTPPRQATNIAVNAMNSISCPTSRTCIAVGGQLQGTNTFHKGIYLRVEITAP